MSHIGWIKRLVFKHYLNKNKSKIFFRTRGGRRSRKSKSKSKDFKKTETEEDEFNDTEDFEEESDIQELSDSGISQDVIDNKMNYNIRI